MVESILPLCSNPGKSVFHPNAPLLAIALAGHLAAAAPGLATEARLFLRWQANGADHPRDLRVGPPWVPGAEIATRRDGPDHLADIRFPVQWWRWSQVDVSFNPTFTGNVELALAGPWAAGPDGGELRLEILWDEIHASGTTLKNGGFETPGPAHWESPWKPYPAATEWPLADAPVVKGKASAASWHGRPLTQSLPVRAGEPVRLTLHARAATPPDFKAPAIPGPDSPAHRAHSRLRRGVNLGNGWEAAPGEFRLTFLPADIDRIADEGFDHIRVPVAWHHHLAGDRISPTLLAELEPVLRRALDRQLTVLLAWQNHPELMKSPADHRDGFVAGWSTIAGHFASWPPALLLNLLNEPSDQLAGDHLNDLYRETIAAIRRHAPGRTLVVEPESWSTVGGLDRLRLPAAENNAIVSIHCYEPFPITHQGASWVGLEAWTGLTFPGPPPHPLSPPENLPADDPLAAWLDAYNRRPAAENPGGPAAVEPLLARAAEWSRTFGRPLHIGEFGATRALDPASRTRYARAFREAAERHRLPWCWWEWKAGFGFLDPDSNSTPLRQALLDTNPIHRNPETPPADP